MTARVKAILILGMGLLATLLAVPGREDTSTPGAPGAPAPASTITVEPVGEQGNTAGTPEPASARELEAQRARRKELDWVRNPFEGPTLAAVEPQEASVLESVSQPPPPAPAAIPRLTGVSRRGNDRWAIIDGEIVRAGDALSSGHDVVSIAHRSVTLLWNDQELRLILGEER